jgi:hypothetical protein
MKWCWLLLAAFPLATSATADPQLSQPIACTLGRIASSNTTSIPT